MSTSGCCNPVCQQASWWKRAPAAPVATALEGPSLKEPLPDQNRAGRVVEQSSALHLCNQASQPQGSQTQRSQIGEACLQAIACHLGRNLYVQ
jgi:hypothetical protein